MKDHQTTPHPGPFRIPRVDAEIAGIVVALGFIMMGIVAIPIVKWFLLGALVFGSVIALVLKLAGGNDKGVR